MSKLAFRAQTVDIAYLPLRQDLFGISVWATARLNIHPSSIAPMCLADRPFADHGCPVGLCDGVFQEPLLVPFVPWRES